MCTPAKPGGRCLPRRWALAKASTGASATSTCDGRQTTTTTRRSTHRTRWATATRCTASRPCRHGRCLLTPRRGLLGSEQAPLLLQPRRGTGAARRLWQAAPRPPAAPGRQGRRLEALPHG